MKNFINAISGKKAMYVMIVLALIGAVLQIITSIRLGTKNPYTAMGLIFCNLAIWADSLEKKEKKEKNAQGNTINA